MDKKEFAKIMVRFVSSAAVGTVVSNVLRTNAPIPTSAVNKVLVGIGELILASMVADKAGEYVVESFFGPEEVEAPTRSS